MEAHGNMAHLAFRPSCSGCLLPACCSVFVSPALEAAGRNLEGRLWGPHLRA